MSAFWFDLGMLAKAVPHGLGTPTGLRSWLNSISWAVVRLGSLSTASLFAQWATFEVLTFSMMASRKAGSSLEWKTAAVATGLLKLALRLLEAVGCKGSESRLQ